MKQLPTQKDLIRLIAEQQAYIGTLSEALLTAKEFILNIEKNGDMRRTKR